MRHTGLKKIFYFLAALLIFITNVQAQQPPADTTQKQINIIHANKITFKKIDSLNEFQLLVGNVAVQQDKTLFYCDSAALNNATNVMESFGHVHINDNDSLHIYSDYLKYLGKEKKALLTGNVKLTDGKGILTTPRLDYDLSTHIGNYSEGGKVVNDKTVLTSRDGYYYEDTRDVYFKNNVVLVNPDYTIKTDTLLYNTYTAVATFTVPTEITSDSGRKKIYTKDGFYDTKNKKAYFGKRPEIHDGSTTIIGDEVANDDSTGFGEARGNVIYRDTAQKVTILANHMNTNRKDNSFLATQKPVMIIQQEDDSIFIAADTLYSARLSDLRRYRNVPYIKGTAPDKSIPVNTEEDEEKKDLSPSNAAGTLDSAKLSDLRKNKNAAFIKRTIPGKSISDSTKEVEEKKDSLPVKDTPAINTNTALVIKDSVQEKVADTVQTISPISLQKVDTTIHNDNDSTDRFFEAYYHVRIYSDSLQAVGDSLFYSGQDSVFRLFKQPVVWSRESQITGDTIYLFTQNKKPARLYVFENALTINKVGPSYYNQIKGRTINGYFKDGNIDYMRTKGNAESIYYAQDENNKYIGVNKASSDIIDMYFEDKKPQRVIFRSNLVGTTYPMRQINHEELRLRGFKWLEDLRPKSKYELFAN